MKLHEPHCNYGADTPDGDFCTCDCPHCTRGLIEDPQHGQAFFCTHCEDGKKLREGLTKRMKQDD